VTRWFTSCTTRLFQLLVLPFALFAAVSVIAQISPAEHAQHHPGQSAGGTNSSIASGMGGMMEGMDEMMKGMGVPPQKELYPSLMALPELTPEKRREVEQRASERMQVGTKLMGQALDALNAGARSDNYAAMHEATLQLREGIAQFESGVAARRALTEGRAPRDVALAWLKREMNLPLTTAPALHQIFGGARFHLVVIGVLAAFAAAMIAMYFFKMRRAVKLLQSLTGGTAPAPAASAATIAPPTSAPQTETRASAASSDASKKWSGQLRIAQIFQETDNVKTFRLMNPIGGPLPFSYLPGQFLTVTVPINGKPVKRSYTLASSPTQQDFAEITVKHEEPGEVSAFLHRRVQPGDLLEFSGPSGSFIFTGRECKCILLIGGGVGITPLMSVIRYLTDRSWAGDIYLLYSIGKPQEFIFREELEHLQRRHPNVRVIVTVSHPEGTDWKGPTGRITKEFITQSVPDLASRYVHICGPVPMMEAVRKLLADLGVPTERIKTEAFGPALGKPEPTRSLAIPAPTTTEQTRIPTVSFARSDKSASLPPDKTILDVADEIGVPIDNSCRVGTCGTCRVKLLSGQVTMAVEDGLEPGDKEQRIILACQAKSTGVCVVEA
jgi:glycine betaine catabolism B